MDAGQTAVVRPGRLFTLWAKCPISCDRLPNRGWYHTVQKGGDTPPYEEETHMPNEVLAFTEEDRAALKALAAETETEPIFLPHQPEELQTGAGCIRRKKSRRAEREKRPEGVSDEDWAIFQSSSICGGIQPIREEELQRDAEYRKGKESRRRKSGKGRDQETVRACGGIQLPPLELPPITQS